MSDGIDGATIGVRKARRRWLFSKSARICIVSLLAVFYGLTLWAGLTEERRRALSIEEDIPQGDAVLLDILVTGIDTVKGLLFIRIRIVPLGALARDENTPAKDLTLLLNSVSGQQSVSFPKGRRIEPVDATTVLAGDSNKYPFETYRADIDAVVSIPAKQSVEQLHIDTLGIAESIDPEDLIVGVGDLTHSQLVPICEKVTASIPQFKFSGVVERDGTHKLTHTHISSRRANSVIMTSLAVMITMLLSALSVAAMVVRAALSDGEMDLLPLMLCMSLIFGLPALRNTQPNVPEVGVLGDYVSFIWASFIVSFSALALIWTWIARTKAEQRAQRFHNHTK